MFSICIFGSQARKTADRISDRDMLLIGDAGADLEGAAAKWKSAQWNVSVFDRPAFTRMAEVRSLFVQHIKQEGRIVEDSGHYLRAELSKYSPKTDYSGERNDSLHQIIDLPQANGQYWRDMCIADASYVLFRNALILHFACNSAYCFQFDTLVDQIASEFRLDSGERRLMLKLRELKHGYRNRVHNHQPVAALSNVRRIAQLMLAAVDNSSVSGIASGLTSNDYLTMRLREIELVSTHDVQYLDSLVEGDALFRTWSNIKGIFGYPKDKIRWH